MQALILCGGLGTRLRNVVSDRPKCMAPVAGRPFLEYLVRQLKRYDFADIVLCTGYMDDLIRDYFQDGTRLGVRLDYSHEDRPLGTGGAIKLAQRFVSGKTFLAVNGDSILNVDLHQLLVFHDEKRALVTLALTSTSVTGDTIPNLGGLGHVPRSGHVPVEERNRYGTVELNPDSSVTWFAEKAGEAKGEPAHPGLINGGVYAVNRQVLDSIPTDQKISLETDVLPGLLGKGVFGMAGESYFIDIGLPEDYRRVQENPQELLRIAGLS